MPWSCLFEASWVGLPYCYDVWLGALFARLCFQTQVAHNENSKWKSFRAVCAMHCALNECNDARCTNKNDSKFPRTAVMASLADGGSSSRDPCATTAHVGLRVNMKHVHACVNNEKKLRWVSPCLQIFSFAMIVHTTGHAYLLLWKTQCPWESIQIYDISQRRMVMSLRTVVDMKFFGNSPFYVHGTENYVLI